jgi:hypothetical protein
MKQVRRQRPGAGAMLVACRLAGLSALEAYYAGVRARAQCEAACDCATRREHQRRHPAAGRDGGEGAALTGLVAHKLI